MSKIQEALEKLQSAGNLSARRSRPAISTPLPDDTAPVPVLSVEKKVVDVGLDALRAAGMVAPERDKRLIADQFREIKRPLIAHAFGRRATQVPDGHLIMVSSAIAGEGKTFAVVNLALSMARERDYSVLLVDGDVVKPHISNVLGLSKDIGLLDILDNRSIHPESAVLPTNVDGLSILPAGKHFTNTTELLASERMDEVLSTLGSSVKNRIVLFDSAPLLQTSESKILGSVVGQIILVVRAESTEQNLVDDAIDSLDEDKAVSLILNQARSVKDGHVYAYGGNQYAENSGEEGDQ